jgi:hypothetical protein
VTSPETVQDGTAPWLDSLNSLGLDSAVLAPFEPGYFLDRAQERTGLSGFGDDHFLGPLHLYLEALQGATLSLIGHMLKAQEVLRLLENRLRIEDEIARNPDISDGEIRAPIFIVSLPRAGSSILFELMACKRGMRTPRFWEAVEPCPPPEDATYETDPRIRSTEDAIESWNRVVPAMRSRHLMAPNIPVECIQIQALSFVSHHLAYGTLNYLDRLSSDDFIASYRYHKRVLQLLQYRTDSKQWLLKAPSHLSHLPELFSVYPDARLVFIHRDPVKAVASSVSTLATIYSVFGAPFDEDAYFRICDKQARAQLGAYLALHEGLQARGRVVHVRYQELMSAPLDTIDGIFGELGYPLETRDRHAISEYWTARPRDIYGHHSYSTADDRVLPGLRERYADYTAQFGIEEER